MLKRAPSYRTLELELLEWQERELFEYFVVVSLKKKPSRNTYLPEVSYQFPKVSMPACLPSWPLLLVGPSGKKKPSSFLAPPVTTPPNLFTAKREDKASGARGIISSGP